MTGTSELDHGVAMITGGGSGIGAALCRRLAARGTSVVVADLGADAANGVAAEIDGLSLTLDVSDRAAWETAMATVIDTFGRLDLLALNAGIMSRPRGAAMNDDPFPWIAERYELVRSVNIDGVFHGIMTALPHLQAAAGHIVCTSSAVGLKPLPADPVYSMTKHAVIGLVRSLAGPLAERGISIGAVCPGGVDTPMVGPDVRALDREFATPDHIAEALELVLDAPLVDTGGIWISRERNAPWRHEFDNPDIPPPGHTQGTPT